MDLHHPTTWLRQRVRVDGPGGLGMKNGVIVFRDEVNGGGFIRSDDQDIILLARDTPPAARVGSRVVFALVKDDYCWPSARRVRLI